MEKCSSTETAQFPTKKNKKNKQENQSQNSRTICSIHGAHTLSHTAISAELKAQWLLIKMKHLTVQHCFLTDHFANYGVHYFKHTNIFHRISAIFPHSNLVAFFGSFQVPDRWWRSALTRVASNCILSSSFLFTWNRYRRIDFHFNTSGYRTVQINFRCSHSVTERREGGGAEGRAVETEREGHSERWEIIERGKKPEKLALMLLSRILWWFWTLAQ